MPPSTLAPGLFRRRKKRRRGRRGGRSRKDGGARVLLDQLEFLSGDEEEQCNEEGGTFEGEQGREGEQRLEEEPNRQEERTRGEEQRREQEQNRREEEGRHEEKRNGRDAHPHEEERHVGGEQQHSSDKQKSSFSLATSPPVEQRPTHHSSVACSSGGSFGGEGGGVSSAVMAGSARGMGTGYGDDVVGAGGTRSDGKQSDGSFYSLGRPFGSHDAAQQQQRQQQQLDQREGHPLEGVTAHAAGLEFAGGVSAGQCWGRETMEMDVVVERVDGQGRGDGDGGCGRSNVWGVTVAEGGGGEGVVEREEAEAFSDDDLL